MGTIGVAKSCARVTPLCWNVISIRESSRGRAAWVSSLSWGGEGVRVGALPVFFFLWHYGRLVGVGSIIVTPRFARVKGGEELLRYLPSS